jgi:predicted transcriptional regulator
MKKMTIALPEELSLAVAAIAQQKGVSKSAVMREAIATHMETIERSLPTIIGSVSNPEVRGEDTEDWLLEHWLEDIEKGWSSEPGNPEESPG